MLLNFIYTILVAGLGVTPSFLIEWTSGRESNKFFLEFPSLRHVLQFGLEKKFIVSS